MEEIKTPECCCSNRHKDVPRSEETIRQMKNRISRLIGQLNGIQKMLDDNRYCGDILIQIAAVQSALKGLGYMVFKEHMETCVSDRIKSGDSEIIDETIELIKKFKG